ncbi:MAG: isocitrate lyase/PEP mutase family protein [Pseudolabrys sp.]
MSASDQLRKILSRDELIIAPGAYDGLTARLVVDAGFPVVYATGAGISNSQLGLADMGLLTMSEMLDQARKMVNAVDAPVITDVDTGYGNALNLYRTVREFQRAGVAAVQIEDQVIPKKCGHFTGKQVIPFDEAVLKIKAAVEARGDDSLVIIARTDAIAVEGFDEAMRRARAYVDAGADALFVEAPRSLEQMATIGRDLPGIKIANIVEGGHTPIVPAKDLAAMGFRIAIYANMVLRSSVKAIQKSLKHLHQAGDSEAILGEMITVEERARLTQKPKLDAMEKQYVYAV